MGSAPLIGRTSPRRPRVVFFGTPDFAVPTLEALVASEHLELTGVVTQPDRPAGRGRQFHAPPVKTAAMVLGVPVLQASTLRDDKARAWLRGRGADLYVVAAFGLILGRMILTEPSLGAVNVHASLLPAYRGASPVASAIAMGEVKTGVSLMQMDAGLDTGPVYARQAIDISQEDTTASLTQKLATLGAHLLYETLPGIVDGTVTAQPQMGSATLTRPLVKADGRIDWRRRPEQIINQVRAMMPWPRAFTTSASGTQFQLLEVRVDLGDLDLIAPAGQIMVDRGHVFVACGSGRVEIVTAQIPGARPTSGAQLVQRRALLDGERLLSDNRIHGLPPLVINVGEEV